MHIRKLFLLATILCSVCSLNAQRHEQLLETGWKFHKGETNGAEAVTFNDSQWESVCVPHDWAIYGPFDRNNDLQNVAITQNLEKQDLSRPDVPEDFLMWEWDGIAPVSMQTLIKRQHWFLTEL